MCILFDVEYLFIVIFCVNNCNVIGVFKEISV